MFIVALLIITPKPEIIQMSISKIRCGRFVKMEQYPAIIKNLLLIYATTKKRCCEIYSKKWSVSF